jgi:hypothetical protein
MTDRLLQIAKTAYPQSYKSIYAYPPWKLSESLDAWWANSLSIIKLFFVVKPPNELGIVAQTVVVRAYPLLQRIYRSRLAKTVEVA